MGPWPVRLRGPRLGAGRGHSGQSCPLAKDKGGSGLGTQLHLLPARKPGKEPKIWSLFAMGLPDCYVP